MGDASVDYFKDFHLFQKNLPDGWRVSERVVDPVICIRRAEKTFVAELFGRRVVRGEEKLVRAFSPEHNWIVEDNVVRPLPRDAPAKFQSLIGTKNSASLNFAEVITLVTDENSLITVQADRSVFEPASDVADKRESSVTVPGLCGTLYPYQAKGVQWMLDTIRHTGGIILADEMGLGKTVQIISLLLIERPSNDAPALIVCPTSLIANWRSELLKFGPPLSLSIHRGMYRAGISRGLQRSQVVITTYDTLVIDQSIFSGVEWSWLICDEAQALKNPDSARRQVIATVPRKRTIPMTGTPVETSLLNLWSLVDISIPGLLGERARFEGRYPDSETAAHELRRFTDPIILRRRVSDVAGDLPERIDTDVPLELGDELAALYNRVREETLEKYPVAGALVATGQLQLFCAHPWLQGWEVDIENENARFRAISGTKLITPKIERTIAILHGAFAAGRKVLVFALFNRCGDLIRQAGTDLPDCYWGSINGSTPQEDRQRIVDDFSAYAGPACLVLNPKAAGTGLNITAATVVVHYTQSWNPAIEAQASARAHRRGQTEPVNIYRLFYEDTVERVMIDRAEWRRELGNEAVPVSTRDGEDLRRALQIRPDDKND